MSFLTISHWLRWIDSSCLCFALSTDEQQATDFRYDDSISQAEYSRNDLFARGRKMESFFQELIDRVRRVLDVKRLKTIFGRKRRPFTTRHGTPPPRLEMQITQHEYDLTVLKVHFGKLTLKVYSKGAGVLRVEAIVHNARELKCGIVLAKYTEIVARLRAMVEQFAGVLADLDRPWIEGEAVEDLSRPSECGARRLAGIDLTKPRMQAALESLLSLSARPDGFTSQDLAELMSPRLPGGLSVRQAAYDLRKFRGKGLVEPVTKTHRYRISPAALRPLAALWVLRERVIFPLLSRHGHLQSGRQPKHQSSVDAQYHRLQREMQSLFKLLNIAA